MAISALVYLSSTTLATQFSPTQSREFVSNLDSALVGATFHFAIGSILAGFFSKLCEDGKEESSPSGEKRDFMVALIALALLMSEIGAGMRVKGSGGLLEVTKIDSFLSRDGVLMLTFRSSHLS